MATRTLVHEDHVNDLEERKPLSSLTEFLFPTPAQRNVGAIVTWWEKRRVPYNLMVGAAGLASVAWIGVAEFLAPGGAGFILVPWQPIVLFGVGANVFYTLGSVFESIALKIWGREVLPIGPGLYRMGLTFSVGLALLPGMIFTVSMIIRIILAIVGVI